MLLRDTIVAYTESPPQVDGCPAGPPIEIPPCSLVYKISEGTPVSCKQFQSGVFYNLGTQQP